MSWSVSLFGTSEKVAAALENHGNNKMTGQSKVEWDEVKPHLIALVKSNFMTEDYLKQYPGRTEPLVKLDASGSGSAKSDGTQLQRYCTVKIENIYTKLVL